MYCGNDIRTSLVYMRMNNKAGGVNGVHIASNNHAFGVDQAEIVWFDVCKASAVRVDPEMIRKDGVADCHVASSALVIIAFGRQPAKRRRLMEFSKRPLIF